MLFDFVLRALEVLAQAVELLLLLGEVDRLRSRIGLGFLDLVEGMVSLRVDAVQFGALRASARISDQQEKPSVRQGRAFRACGKG